MKTMQMFKWYDSDTTDTVRLAAQAYGLRVAAIEPTDDPHEIQVALVGSDESLDRFAEDLEDGSCEPMESKREMGEDEYQDWLRDELMKLGIKYVPNYPVEDEDELA